MKSSPLFLLCAIAAFYTANLQAQCRSFVKNNCAESMGEYVPSENFSAAKFMPGDEAELAMTFSKGEDYRLLICSQSTLGDVGFKIFDADKNLLFDNSEKEFADSFDFRVPGTQELTVAVKVPDGNNKTLSPQGCVAIIVGKKVTQ